MKTQITAGTSNVDINRPALEERAKLVGVTQNQLEELSDQELDRLVTLLELKDY